MLLSESIKLSIKNEAFKLQATDNSLSKKLSNSVSVIITITNKYKPEISCPRNVVVPENVQVPVSIAKCLVTNKQLNSTVKFGVQSKEERVFKIDTFTG